MARVWVEAFRKGRHSPPFEYSQGFDDHVRTPGLIPKDVLLVSVASFTFQFFSVEQIRGCLAYYEWQVQPSGRQAVGSADHWEVQRWFERLPMYLLEKPKRLKVVRALGEALVLAELHAFG